MVRQCAWCLHMMDSNGKRISYEPFPKLYEASHGMCLHCVQSWADTNLPEEEAQLSPAHLILELQQKMKKEKKIQAVKTRHTHR